MESPCLIYGEEDYLIDDFLRRIKKSYLSPGLESLNYNEFSLENFTFEGVYNACETLPFMAEKKLVLINNADLFKSANQMDKKKKESVENLRDYIGKISPDNVLIIVEKLDSIRKNNGLYKDINKFGQVYEMEKLNMGEFKSWIKNYLSKYDLTINNTDLHYLVEKTSYLDNQLEKNLYDIENELDKIVSYLGQGGNVDKSIIDSVIVESLELNIFKLLDSISKRKAREAIDIYTEIYLGGKAPLFILHMISRQLRNILNIKLLKLKGYSDNAARKKLGLSYFEYNKLLKEVSKFQVEQLENYIGLALEADRNIKTGKYKDRLALELLIVKLCSL